MSANTHAPFVATADRELEAQLEPRGDRASLAAHAEERPLIDAAGERRVAGADLAYVADWVI